MLLLTDPKNQPLVGDLFDDPEEVQRYLVEEEVLTASEAQSIMASAVNISQVSNIITRSTFITRELSMQNVVFRNTVFNS